MEEKRIPLCPHCGRPMVKSETKGYAWQCLECDEDFYDIEVKHEVDSVIHEVWLMGLNKDGLPDGIHEEMYASFKEKADAIDYAYQKAFTPFEGCEHTEVRVELVGYDKGNAECLELIYEREVERNEDNAEFTDYQVWLMALNEDGSFDTTASECVASFENESEAIRYAETRKFEPFEDMPYTSVRIEQTLHHRNGGQSMVELIKEFPVE